MIANGHLEDAEEAVSRARQATEEAEIHLREARAIARRLRLEREANHFAPEIAEAMRRKDT